MGNDSWRVMCAIESDALNEHNDCGLRAVSIATGLPYRMVRMAFAERGRRPRCGVRHYMVRGVLESFGYRMQEISAPGKTFRAAVRNLKEYPWSKPVLLSSSPHIACFRDGELQDHASERLYRVTGAWIVTKRRTS